MSATNPTELFDFSKSDNRRSFALLAIGAIVGLGIAGYGLFTASGTVTNNVPPEYVAIVNQRPIYRSDFNLQLQSLYDVAPERATAEQKHKVLEDMLNEELLVQRGLETDLAAFDQDVRAALVAGMETDMYASVRGKQHSEAELNAYYQQHTADYASPASTRLRDLIVAEVAYEQQPAHSQRLSAAVAALRQGMAVDTAIKRFHLRDSGHFQEAGKPDLNPIYDYVLKDRLPEKVYAAVTRLKSGEVSDPIQAADGEHIVVVAEQQPSIVGTFAEVRGQVDGDLTRAEEQRVWDSTMKYLLSKSVILLGKE